MEHVEHITSVLQSEDTKQTLLEFLNPLELSVPILLVLLVAKFLAEEVLDSAIVFLLKHVHHPQLPGREKTNTNKGLVRLEASDYLCLFLNQFIELLFLTHLLRLAWKELPKDLESLTFSNTVVAFYLCFLVDDLLYYWLHRFMHVPWVYPYIHKHHHRQTLPVRGYLDAANEHPFEQVGGLLAVWVTIRLLEPVCGFHAITAIVFFAVYASLAVLNHLPYDVKFGVWGLKYEVKAHESHHRLLRCNYSQNTMLWDYLFGTWKP